jgi:hypothetical protein
VDRLLILVRMIGVIVHIINSPNQISLIASLKVVNLTAVRNCVEVKQIDESDFRLSANAPNEGCIQMVVPIAVVNEIICMSRC